MTDRVHSLTVVLEHDYRADDVEKIVDTLYQIRGVLSVDEHISDVTSHMSEARAKQELREKLWELLK